MASGDSNRYSSNAISAARGTKACSAGGCPSCVKSGLPVLLTRPGLAEARYAARSSVQTRQLMAGLSAPDLKFSDYVMRTLRTGYVYVYYQTSEMHALIGGDGWEAYAVDEAGYVSPIPLENPPLPEEMPRFSCERAAGYAAAMLINIKEPSKAGEVWVGFSEVPLSLKVRQNYAAKPELLNQRFTRLNASNGQSDRVLALSDGAIQGAIVDYDVERGRMLEGLRGNPHRPGQVALDRDGKVPEKPASEDAQTEERRESAKDVAAAAAAIAATSKDPAAKRPLILGVSDPVGMAHEAAHLRLTLPSKAVKWLMAQRDGARRLQTAVTLVGVQQMLVEQARVREADFRDRNPPAMSAMDLRAEMITKAEFEARQKAGIVPSSASWSPIAIPMSGPWGSGVASSGQNGYGNVSVPGGAFEADALELIEKIKKKASGRTRDTVTGKWLGWEDYLKEFGRFSTEDKALRKRIQGDHRDLLSWNGRKLITEFDFDETSPADGIYYSQVVANLLHGGPIDDEAVAWYADFVKDDPSNKDNLLVRAMLGNQQDSFDQFAAWSVEEGQRNKATDILNNLLDLAEKLSESNQGGKASALAVKHVGTLRVLARAYASPLIAMVGAVALGAGKVKKTLSPALYDRVMVLISSMVKRAAPQITHLIVDAPLRMAGRAWREVSRAFTAAAADTPAGKQSGVKSLVVGSGSSLQLAGAGEAADTRVKLHLWTNQSEEQLRALQSTTQQGQAVASARPAPGSTAATGAAAAVAAAPITMGSSGLMSLASATPKVIADAPTVMSAGAGIIQAMEIAKAWKKMEVGTAKERRDAIFSFFSAGFSVVSAFVDVAKAYAQAVLKKVLVKRLEAAVAIFAAIGSFIDSVQGFISTADDIKNGRRAGAVAHLLQGISFFIGGVFFSIYAASLLIQGLGVTTSWLGWGIVFIVIGFALGFVASLLMTHPMEDWAARTVWGDSISSAWATNEIELQELNKVLLGIEVDAQYRSSLSWRNLTSIDDVIIGGAVKRMTAHDSGSRFTREFVVKLKIVEQVRKRLGISLQVYGNGANGSEVVAIYSTDEKGGPGENWGSGVSSGKMDYASLDALTISGFVESGRFSVLAVELIIRDALSEGDVIVHERMAVE
ncbi:T6SS effector BTH_I2691 family protein [Stenotrophomonas maltophilia]|uniref:T6SS effector BTH_I2691 family protein n=2 Tax=Stenotrophomonas TaxID=40323 RepID=UPI0013A65515|nr:T6SS effector BTH_I2691 family protein [Stenotrophomonas maltophilia]